VSHFLYFYLQIKIQPHLLAYGLHEAHEAESILHPEAFALHIHEPSAFLDRLYYGYDVIGDEVVRATVVQVNAPIERSLYRECRAHPYFATRY